MGYFIYNILIHIVFILLIPFLIIKNLFSRDYSYSSIYERFGFLPSGLEKNLLLSKKNGKKIIWLHAGSVGEVIITKDLINGLEKATDNFLYIVSTGGRSGREMAVRYFKENTFLLPFDIPWIINRVLKKINPDLVVMVEPDLWPNFIKYTSSISNIILLNAWFNSRNIGQFKYLPGFLTEVISNFELISLQDKKYLDILKDMGVKSQNIKITGNIKFDIGDRVTHIDTKIIRKRYKIGAKKEIIVAGSTHPGEEEILLEVHRTLSRDNDQLVLIIAPRHIERADSIIELFQKNDIKAIRKSELVLLKKDHVDYDIIILDTLGELTDLYSIATIVFVGGSLVPKGGHNLFEPVIYGKPVFFGSYINDVREMAELILEYEIGYKVSDMEELLSKIRMVLEDKKLQKKIEDSSMRLLAEQEGIVKKNLDYIIEFLEK